MSHSLPDWADVVIGTQRAPIVDRSAEEILTAFCEPLDLMPPTSRWNSLTVILALADLVVLTMIGDASSLVSDDPACVAARDEAVIGLLSVPRLGGPETTPRTIRKAYEASTYLPSSGVVDHGVDALRYLVATPGALRLIDRVESARAAGHCVRAAGPAARAVAIDVLWTLR